MTRVLFSWAGVLAIASLFTNTLWACPFCGSQGTTLSTEVKQAAMVLYGTLSNAKQAPGEFNQGTTDLTIDLVIRDNPFRAGRKVITLPRYLPVDAKKQYKYLVFCDVFQGQLDPYRGIASTDGTLGQYLKGSLEIQNKDIGTRLRYFFGYLDAADTEVANDAYQEFGNADYRDYRQMAKDLPADKIAGWLKDPNTPVHRFGTYGSLLGHCGTVEHAKLLRQMMDDANRRFSTQFDGMLAGYILLQPTEGWAYARSLAGDAKQDFLIRYAVLRAVRFFWDYRPDVVPHQQLITGITPMLDQSDVADLIIDDLRKWNRWDLCAQVLALGEKPSHDKPLIKRSILRYALSAPAGQAPKAIEYVRVQRAQDPEKVKDVEVMLQADQEKPAPTPEKPKS